MWYAAHCIYPDQIPMHCIACVERYSRRLSKVKGPHEMDIGVSAGRLSILTFSPARVGVSTREFVLLLEFFLCHTLCRWYDGIPESGFGGSISTEPDGAAPGRVASRRSLACYASGGLTSGRRKGRKKGKEEGELILIPPQMSPARQDIPRGDIAVPYRIVPYRM